MPYQAEAFAEQLRDARKAKGWSQRDLSQKAGATQTHISKIESGAVDMRLSTLAELARLLDLDVVLVPRSALPPVQSLIREAEANTDTRNARGAVTRLKRAARFLDKALPHNTSVERLPALAQEIETIAPLFQAPGALSQLLQAVTRLEALAAEDHPNARGVEAEVDNLRNLRNGLVHARGPVTTPAYSLDDED